MTVPPRRLLESTPATAEERLLAQHLRAAAEPPPPLSAAATERIARRVAGAAPPSLWPRRALWSLLVAAPLAMAAAWAVRRSPEPSVPEVEAPPATVAVTEPVSVADAPTVVVPVEEAPAVKVTPPHRSMRAQPAVVARAEPPPPTPPPAAPDPLLEEARLLREALGHLRTRRDGSAALAVLGEYDARFPQGQLRAEAVIARVDALLILGDSTQALRTLRSLPRAERDRLPRKDELEVLEAELLAKEGRCEEAARLAQQAPAGLAERGLFVEATCAAKAGRHDAARGLYEELLRRSPTGTHAEEARRALGRGP